MPSTPEVGDGDACIRGIEIDGETESEQQGYAYRHITVSGEVAIDLERITVHSKQIFHPAVELGIVEYAVYKVETDVIADDGLLEESDDDEVDAAAEHFVGDDKRLTYLRHEIARPDDRARHQLREEGYIKGVVEQTVERTDVSPIHIDGIAHALEGEETDAHRQENIVRLKIAADDIGQHATEEIGVLEVEEETQIDDETQQYEPAHAPLVARMALKPTAHALGDGEVGARHHSQYHEVKSATLIIEIVREERDEEEACRVFVLKRHIDECETEKEHQKKSAAEYHRSIGIVREYIAEGVQYLFFHHLCRS